VDRSVSEQTTQTRNGGTAVLRHTLCVSTAGFICRRIQAKPFSQMDLAGDMWLARSKPMLQKRNAAGGHIIASCAQIGFSSGSPSTILEANQTEF
jgi:hypothetical protein